MFPPNVQTKPFCIILSICSESALVRTIQNLKVPRPDLHMVKERGFMQCHVGDQGLLSPMSSWGCKLWWAKRSHAVRQARFEKYGTINNQLRGLMRRSRFYRNLIQAESCIEHLCPCARVCVCVCLSVMIVHVCLSAESFCSAWGSSMTSWQLLNCWQHSCACLFSSIQLRHRSLALPKKLRRQLSAKKRRHPADTTAPSCFPQCQPPRLGRTNTQFCTPMTGIRL